MSESQACPKCGEDCSRDEVHNGVCVLYGPWGCPGCGWSSDPEYDHSDKNGGACAAQAEHPGWYVDQWGGLIRKSALKEGVARFGVDPGVIDTASP